MTWRLARSLETLRQQLNAISPNRSKASDGTVGDLAHSSRTSDHNPNAAGVVCALDITHDPAHGIDSEHLAEMLRASKDGRVKYIISNKKIANAAPTAGKPAWAWRSYTGSNPHNKHVHVSVKAEKASYDSTKAWALNFYLSPDDAQKPAKPELPVLRKGDKGPDVEKLQALLNKHGAKLTVDANFGAKTVAAVKEFQRAHKLIADAVVGGYTWEALGA